MAKFVVAGKANCPYYAKAEHLADCLQATLPNFRVHKITQHPDKWEQWLHDVCETNGWEHRQSPIIWRELLDRGGKGQLLGGLNDFLEYAQQYYGITSMMLSKEMLDIAEENLQAHLEIVKEDEKIKSLIKPMQIWITSASTPICYQLIPLLANGEVFGMTTEISIHLLDTGQFKEVLCSIVMEAEDMAFPLLRSILEHTEIDEAFIEADVIIVLDDVLLNLEVQSLENYIREATLIMTYGPSIKPENIIAVATSWESAAKATLARKLNVSTAGVKDVIVWGNITGSNYIDLLHAKLYGYDGAIWGPANFQRPLLNMIYDREWIHSEFLSAQGSLRSRVGRCTGMLPAHAVATALQYWYHGSPPGEIVSVGVLSEGQFCVPEGIIFSMPVSFQNGSWEVIKELEIDGTTQEVLGRLAHELIQEKLVALKEIKEIHPYGEG
ncbi:putative malate dehydrogenase 1B isoform X2 [Pipra filicauda]|uniref:Putative malate dehydrogenase 1B n=1 Tax=Pipra filicauda TaxID=649802 RepID=A0A6J2HIL3_9PASS|nr:putative malate dehydrogenase 1B isoform X2 [Pipra filicauda]